MLDQRYKHNMILFHSVLRKIFCSKIFKDRTILKQHMESVHGKTFEQPTNFVCHFCEKSFDSNLFLQAHCEKLHREIDGTFACKTCQKRYVSLSAHRNHMMVFHRGVDKHTKFFGNVEKETDFVCHFCEELFDTNFLLVAHCNKQHLGSDGMFLCDKCQKRYESLTSHRNHVMNCQQAVDTNIDNIAEDSFDKTKDSEYFIQEAKNQIIHVRKTLNILENIDT